MRRIFTIIYIRLCMSNQKKKQKTKQIFVCTVVMCSVCVCCIKLQYEFEKVCKNDKNTETKYIFGTTFPICFVFAPEHPYPHPYSLPASIMARKRIHISKKSVVVIFSAFAHRQSAVVGAVVILHLH